jgi:dTMP kinase
MAGRFITFEGGEGAGKTTQIRRLAERLRETGETVIVTREPGGTPNAEAIRRLLLSGVARQLGSEGEAVLFASARADHVERVIRPALAAGQWVLCDRFSDSTRVYQADVDATLLDGLERVAVGDTRPDLTLILDVPAEIGLARAAERMAATGETPDRFEGEALALHETRRQAFLDIARNAPERCVVVDAGKPEAEVAEAVWTAVEEWLVGQAATEQES